MNSYTLEIEHIDGVSCVEVEAEGPEEAADYFINNMTNDYYQIERVEVLG